jgi:predicted 2-oxoglutarate/Fe(II)-dependent dioxygenase YbiX
MIKKSTILSVEEINYLKELYEKLPNTFYEQDHNLFNVYKAYCDTTISEIWNNIQLKLSNFHGRNANKTNYFLRYKNGSYTRIHKDNPGTVEGSSITLIDRSDDLVGGDIIIARKGYTQKIIPQLIGETVHYSASIDHGVTKVDKGERLVLVTWFRKGVWQS